MNRKTYIRPCSALVLLALVGCVSCSTTRPLPPVDFSAPGWRVLQGQAIWKPAPGRPELTGDLLLALPPGGTNGDCYVQFAKNPFPLVTAESLNGQWQIEFGAGERIWRGRGVPPARFVWFQLPHALLGDQAAGPWQVSHPATNSWRLENPRTGETLEGQFFP